MNRSLVRFLLIAVLSLLPLLVSVYLNAFDREFYSSAFSTYEVYSAFPDADSFNSDVLDYLKENRASMPTSISLNERELAHMQDVREVFSVYFLIFWILIVLLLVLLGSLYVWHRAEMRRILLDSCFKAGLYSLCFYGILLLFFFFSFRSSFSFFHTLFFEEGTWVFNATDHLIQIYPSGLFFDLFVRVFIVAVLLSSILLTAGYIGKRRITQE